MAYSLPIAIGVTDQSFDDSADESTLCTPFTDLATATDFCTCALVSTTLDSVTLPFLVVTLMSLDEMPFVVASSAFTFVVIQVSVPGCADLSGEVDIASAANTTPVVPSASATPSVVCRNLFISASLSMKAARTSTHAGSNAA